MTIKKLVLVTFLFLSGACMARAATTNDNDTVESIVNIVRAGLSTGAITGGIGFWRGGTRARMYLTMFVFSSAGLNAINIAYNPTVQRHVSNFMHWIEEQSKPEPHDTGGPFNE